MVDDYDDWEDNGVPVRDEDAEPCPYPTVITIDPGGTTGWCVMAVHTVALADPEYHVLDNVMHWAQGQIVGPEPEQVHQLAELAVAWPTAAIVVEDYVLRHSRKDKASLSPVRITAALEYALWCDRGRTYMIQSPTDAITTATDARLKDWGYYERTGGMEHARDATRHALTWLRKSAGLQRGAVRHRRESWPAYFNADGTPSDGP